MTENEQIQEMAKDIADSDRAALEYCRNTKCKECSYFYQSEDCYMRRISENLIAKGYRKVERGEWISVEDRLPDNNGRVLVYLGNNHHVKTDTDRYFGYWARWGENVTHWMPLPEPPSGADMRGERDEGLGSL